MITEYVLFAVIVILCLLLVVSFLVIWRLVVHLSDKIAIPLYDAASKRTIIARPDPVVAAAAIKDEDKNLPNRESPYAEIDDVPVDDLHAAITGGDK